MFSYTLICYLYVAVSKILAALTECITLNKLGNFNSHTLRKKIFWLVINSKNRSDMSQILLLNMCLEFF